MNDDLIIFEDKPSTKTPWNSKNVNHNFNKLKKQGGVVLFSGPVYEYKTYNLKDSVDNYDILEIFVSRGSDYGSHSSRGTANVKSIRVPLYYIGLPTGTNYIAFLFFYISFEGSTFTINNVVAYYNNKGTISSPSNVSPASNYNRVDMIVGYKY